MTREQLEYVIGQAKETASDWVIDKLNEIADHDAEQRQIIDEQVEENRGLRADVFLMQKANAEQREEIERLRNALRASIEQVKAGHAEVKTITTELEQAKQLEREVWVKIVAEIDHRHTTVTMEQATLKEWCMAKYKELT